MPKSASEKTAAYRARLRAQGLRPIQIWVPDTRIPSVAKEIRRQSMNIAESEGEREDLDFVEALQADNRIFETE